MESNQWLVKHESNIPLCLHEAFSFVGSECLLNKACGGSNVDRFQSVPDYLMIVTLPQFLAANG